jgi:hypothetical protein
MAVVTKKQIKTISNSFSPNVELYFDKQVNLYIDYLDIPNPNEVNILWLCEPDAISNLKQNLHLVGDKFDYILTFDVDVLAKYKNSVLHLQASNWVSLNKEYEPKHFSISTVVGNKLQTRGHVLRQELWVKQEKIKNREFYVGFFGGPDTTAENPILENGIKDPMFKSQFHIYIENCSIQNYFSEKIIDCFVTKTVPIYWGCTNIDYYFNQKGILKFNKINECIDICNNLNDKSYEEFIPYIEDNYNIAMEKYTDWMKNLKETILKLNIEK